MTQPLIHKQTPAGNIKTESRETATWYTLPQVSDAISRDNWLTSN